MKLKAEDGFDIRTDKWLSLHTGLTRSFIQGMIEDDNVFVNGKNIRSNYKIKEGDEIELEIPEPEEPDILPENIPLNIVYEDSDVIVIDKPKNMVVHPAPGHYTGTVVNGLLFHCGDTLSGINGVMRPGIVHRIDMDTTGLIVAAKNDRAHVSLSEQLKEHSITRRYYALVHGNISEDQGTVSGSIGRHPTDRKKMAIDNVRGRNAVTHFRVLERFGDYTFVECRLETGRTHQIRVHMKSINHPVVGDEVYGPSGSPLGKLQGQCLHAGILGFIHPSTGEYMEFRTPLPEYLEKLLEKLRKRNS